MPTDVNHAQGDANHPFNNAANWKEVEHLKAPGQLSASQTNHFTFDKVETYAVRIRMKKANGTDGVGLTEITILGNKVPAASSSEISIRVDGQKLEHFNPAKTDYHIPQTSKVITATASDNGLVTIVPATSPEGATRLILKAEDGTILKEYRIFRDGQKESTQPVAAENAAMTLSVGDKLQLPTEVTVYYPSEIRLSLRMQAIMRLTLKPLPLLQMIPMLLLMIESSISTMGDLMRLDVGLTGLVLQKIRKCR